MRTIFAVTLLGCAVLVARAQVGESPLEGVVRAPPAAARVSALPLAFPPPGLLGQVRRAAVFTVATSASEPAAAPQNQQPALSAVLAAAGAYLKAYERDMAAIVAEEDYLQEIRFENRTRRIRSDLLVLQDPEVGWIGFRDVFEVDERPVRDRNQRLVALFLKPRPDAREQGMRIVREGTRYNLSPRGVDLWRTINMPLTPLYFLQVQNQRRSAFAIDTALTSDDDRSVVVAFSEHTEPRMVDTPDHAAARGAFWIEPHTGRVTAALLTIHSRDTRATIHVTFTEQPGLEMWLPASMNEAYEIGTIGTVVGRADYSNFRRFTVETTTEIER